jgi:hypothetical protein
MIPDVKELWGCEKALIVKGAERRFDIEGMDTGQTNESRISRDMPIWGLEVFFKNVCRRIGRWWEWISWLRWDWGLAGSP